MYEKMSDVIREAFASDIVNFCADIELSTDFHDIKIKFNADEKRVCEFSAEATCVGGDNWEMRWTADMCASEGLSEHSNAIDIYTMLFSALSSYIESLPELRNSFRLG